MKILPAVNESDVNPSLVNVNRLSWVKSACFKAEDCDIWTYLSGVDK
jgi:hypothetical protein